MAMKARKPVEIKPRVEARLNTVITLDDVMDMYEYSKSGAWNKVRRQCVYIQRKPRGTILIDLASVLKAFGTPLHALPTVNLADLRAMQSANHMEQQ